MRQIPKTVSGLFARLVLLAGKNFYDGLPALEKQARYNPI
jgi:hypothetical protein